MPGCGTDVDQVIGSADALFIVLDDDDGVADVFEALEGADEAGVVALVKADGGFIEHVADADEAAADLRGEADALRLAAGERGCPAIEREVIREPERQNMNPEVRRPRFRETDCSAMAVPSSLSFRFWKNVRAASTVIDATS